jgi:hypothetical protein
MAVVPMMILVVLVSGAFDLAVAQKSPGPAPDMPGSAGPKDDKSAVQHGAQPNAEEVRPGNRDGDNPSASAGTLVTSPKGRYVLGLPVNLAIIVAGIVLVVIVAAGIVIPGSRRRARARGNGTYGDGSGR